MLLTNRDLITFKLIESMKYLGSVVLALLVSVAMGQSSSKLRGPAAKNYKAWKDNSLKGSKVNLASASDKYEKGANAKNNHSVTQSVAYTVIPVTNVKRAKGANAKNRRFVSTEVAPVPVKSEAREEEIENSDSIIQRK